MKTPIANLFLLSVLITGLGSILQDEVTAQTFTTLHSFTALDAVSSTNSDGAHPYGGLILAGNTLYGTAPNGGSSGAGTVFAVNTDGKGFATLYDFTQGSDGGNPYATLILSGDTLYGTTSQNVADQGEGYGTVFAINTNGADFTTLYQYTTPIAGKLPFAGLVRFGNTLFGTTFHGGDYNEGTLFSLNTDGTGFTNLHSFTTLAGGFPAKNSDGAHPQGELILSDNTLYGTATEGGPSGSGTVFKVNTDGSGFMRLHTFAGSNGATPRGRLILVGNTLYGTADGGSSGNGTVFAVNTAGTGFTNLFNFTAWRTNSSGVYTNSDGVYPNGLILSGNILYGTANAGGSLGAGTVFAVNTNGTGFTTLYNFTPLLPDYPNYTNSDGAHPHAGLILSGSTLYGATEYGGSSGNGTVFSLSLPPPQLTIVRSAANVILSWSTNATGFVLQSATTLNSGGDWQNFLTPPTEVNGQKVVTITPTGLSGFFRLRGQ